LRRIKQAKKQLEQQGQEDSQTAAQTSLKNARLDLYYILVSYYISLSP
jgi:hypothetical protein